MRSGLPTVAVLGAALVLAGAAACSSQDKEAPKGFVYYDTHGSQGGDAAALTGTLVIDTGCVYVTTNNGRIVPVFPLQDTSMTDNQLVLHERRYADGAAVTLTGGEQLSKPSDTVIPDACSGDSYWIVAPG